MQVYPLVTKAHQTGAQTPIQATISYEGKSAKMLHLFATNNITFLQMMESENISTANRAYAQLEYKELS